MKDMREAVQLGTTAMRSDLKLNSQRGGGAVLVLVLSFLGTVQADLTLSLDTTAQTYAVSGSVTGTPEEAMGVGLFDWSWAPGIASTTQSLFDDIEFTTDDGLITWNGVTVDGTTGGFGISMETSSTSIMTVTGVGAGSYADLSMVNRNHLEGFIGTSQSSTTPTGVGNFNVIAAVPEPSTFPIMGLGAMMIGYRRRKRTPAKRS
jgi:hypothetical protein